MKWKDIPVSAGQQCVRGGQFLWPHDSVGLASLTQNGRNLKEPTVFD